MKSKIMNCLAMVGFMTSSFIIGNMQTEYNNIKFAIFTIFITIGARCMYDTVGFYQERLEKQVEYTRYLLDKQFIKNGRYDKYEK